MKNIFNFLLLSGLLFFGIVFGLLASDKNHDEISYHYIHDDNFDDQELFAKVTGERHTLIGKGVKFCFRIEKIADFNNNGHEDVLVRKVYGCGANCCADSYQIFSYDGVVFRKTEVIGYDWDGIEIINSSNGFKFIVESVYEGFGNTAMCHNKVETFRMVDYDFELIEVVKDQKLSAIAEIRSSEFEDREDETLYLEYDLNGDGHNDTISCTYWSRWGRMGCQINFANGDTYKVPSTPKRVGVMESKTNNVHDLVLECDEVIKWNGVGYER